MIAPGCAARIERAQHLLDELALDALLFVSRSPGTSWFGFDENIRYFCNVPATPAAIVWITRERVQLIVDESFAEACVDVPGAVAVESAGLEFASADEFARTVAHTAPRPDGRGPRVGIAACRVSAEILLRLQSHGHVQFSDIASELSELRLRKDDLELADMQRAGSLARAAVAAMAAQCVPGADRRQLRARGYQVTLAGGASHTWFPVLAGAGDADPGTGPQPVLDGAAVSLDVTPVYNGYAADVARTVLVGAAEKHPAIEFLERLHDYAAEIYRPGMSVTALRQAFSAELERLAPPWEVTLAGHPLGLGDDIYPYCDFGRHAEQFGDWALRDSMVMTLETSIELPEGSCFIENDFIVRDSMPAENYTADRS